MTHSNGTQTYVWDRRIKHQWKLERHPQGGQRKRMFEEGRSGQFAEMSSKKVGSCPMDLERRSLVSLARAAWVE